MNETLKKVFAIMGMVFVAWILLLVFAVDLLFQSFYGWVGFCGGILGFVISVLSLALWKQDGDRNLTEVAAVPLVITSVYFVAALSANTLFCFLAYLELPKTIPLLINAVLTIAFVAVRLFMLPYRNRVLHTAERTAKKTRSTVQLSAKLGEMLGVAQDAAVKQKLKALKEQLDYSNNVSQAFTEDLETLLFAQLCDISEGIDQRAPVEEVLRKLDAAERTWKRRNGASFTN